MKKRHANEVHARLSEEPASYQIDNKTFIVEPVFQKKGTETLGNVLLRLIKSDAEISGG